MQKHQKENDLSSNGDYLARSFVLEILLVMIYVSSGRNLGMIVYLGFQKSLFRLFSCSLDKIGSLESLLRALKTNIIFPGHQI